MSNNRNEILKEVYANTLVGERLRKRESIINEYLNKYGQMILSKELKPTPVMQHLANIYGMSRLGVQNILKSAGIYQGRTNPIVYPSEQLQNA